MEKYLEKKFLKDSRSRYYKGLYDLFLSLLSTENKYYSLVCDVGCGKGIWSWIGMEFGLFKEVVGCDVFFDYKIEELKTLGKVSYKSVKNPPYLPFESNTFDLVFSMDVIEHVEDDHTFFKEHIRIAKPGGVILTGTPNRYRTINVVLMLLGRLKYDRKLGEDSYGECIHIREYSENMIKKLMHKEYNTIQLIPYWLGIGPKIGIEKPHGILRKFCQYWFLLFRKKIE